MRAVMRHRLVYQLLAQQLADSVHALALHLYDPEEWKIFTTSAKFTKLYGCW